MKSSWPHVALCFIPPQSTWYLQHCDVPIFRKFKSCISKQARSTLTQSVVDGSCEDRVMNKAWRRLSASEWASLAIHDLCEKNQVWRRGCSRLRPCSADEFRDAAAEANKLHAEDEVCENNRARARSRRDSGVGHLEVAAERRCQDGASARRAKFHPPASRARIPTNPTWTVALLCVCSTARVHVEQSPIAGAEAELAKNTMARSPHLRQAMLQAQLSRVQGVTTTWNTGTHLSVLNVMCTTWDVLMHVI